MGGVSKLTLQCSISLVFWTLRRYRRLFLTLQVASNDRSRLSLFGFVFGCTWDPLPDVQKFVYRRLLEIERLNLVGRQRL